MAEVVRAVPLLQKVLDCMPEMVCVLTPSWQILVANQAMRIFLGQEEGFLQPGSRPGELIQCAHAAESAEGCGSTPYCSQCGAARVIMESIGQNKQATGECRIARRINGKPDSLDLYLWCSPFDLNGHALYVLAIMDISDRLRRQALERIFFHDLLNSCSALSSSIQLLRNASANDVPQIADRLARAADGLLQEILAQRDLLKAESGELKPNAYLLNTTQLLQELVERFQADPLCRDRRLQLAPLGAAVSFVCDSVLLNRVLGNMVKNALEAAEPGDAVTLGWYQQGEFVEFWVQNPQVIAPEHQLQIFNRSFSTKGTGRGLGTYSMRLLCEFYLEGEVGFTSNQAEGTRFFARVPLRPSYFSQAVVKK